MLNYVTNLNMKPGGNTYQRSKQNPIQGVGSNQKNCRNSLIFLFESACLWISNHINFSAINFQVFIHFSDLPKLKFVLIYKIQCIFLMFNVFIGPFMFKLINIKD